MLYSKTSGVMRFCTSTAKLPNAQGVNVHEGSEEDETHRNMPEGQELARKKKEPKKGERGFIFKNKGTARNRENVLEFLRETSCESQRRRAALSL